MNALVGKYFYGVYDGSMRSGVVAAAIIDELYLVRFDTFVGFTDGEKWPVSLALVSLVDMLGGEGAPREPPAWAFFDTIEDRARYDAWIMAPPPDARARIVSIRKD